MTTSQSDNKLKKLGKANLSKLLFVAIVLFACGGGLVIEINSIDEGFNRYIDNNSVRAGMDTTNFKQELKVICCFGCTFALGILLAYGSHLEELSKERMKKLSVLLRGLEDHSEEEAIALIDEPELLTAAKGVSERMTAIEKRHRQWVAETSHELRTPIAVMRAQLEAFQDGVHAVTPKNLSVLHGEVMALSKLVDDLHYLSKHDVGQVRTYTVHVDLNQNLQEVLEAFEERRISKEIELENLVPPDANFIVFVDASRIRQVFTNLIENSLRYTNKGGKLRISHELIDDRIKVFFDDTEPGVPDEVLERIFERFFRLESSRNRTFGGSGLGLSICQSNMELLGGDIQASKSELGGLRIAISLPLSHGES